MYKGEKKKTRAVKWQIDAGLWICWGLVYQNYSWCNVNDFFLFNIISIITYIYSYTLKYNMNMDDQATNMKISIEKKQWNWNNIKWIVRIITSRVFCW